MPQASRMERKLRKVKRERTLAFRMMDLYKEQRDQARLVSVGLEEELKKRDTLVPKRSVTAQLNTPSTETSESQS